MTTPYVVAVRELCEFAAKSGDLDLRFTPSPSAEQGMAGHQSVASRRGAGYRRELTLRGRFDALEVRGRADGYDPAQGRLEEVKTHRGDLAAMPENQRGLHWAQAMVYGWLLCEQEKLASLQVALVYFEIASEVETPLVRTLSADQLRAFFESLCGRFLEWARAELRHRAARDAELAALVFPHASFRAGQHALARQVYLAAKLRRCLMAQAPTGIGKSVGVLFPALKALAGQRLDKLYFLSVKEAGQAAALAAADTLRAHGAARLRVLVLSAREKACEHPDKACHGASCPLAAGFYDRLPAARAAAVDAGAMSRDTLRRIAAAHRVCPYHLGQEMARWADLVIADCHYEYDPGGALHALRLLNDWRVLVLVDEAHNLVERARAMYSTALERQRLRAAEPAAPAPVRRALRRVGRAWDAALKAQDAPYRAHEAVPAPLLGALRDANAVLAERFAAATGDPGDASGPVSRDASNESPLLEVWFALLAFQRLAESFGAHSVFETRQDVRGRRGDTSIAIRNVVPAPFLKPRFASAEAVVLFSATLAPPHYEADLLGLPRDAAWLDVDGPFVPEQLEVRIATDLSTRYAQRVASLVPIADCMAAQFAARPGNYLAFFSSFEYLEQAAAAFRARWPAVPLWQQSRAMTADDKAAFLRRFDAAGRGIGFAVLGGSFAESIDLPGERLIGAFIATLGLPQVNAENDETARRLQTMFGAGFEYAYRVPGLRKVVQAAGRVIRTPHDVGCVWLLDERFASADVQRLLPSWWRVQRAPLSALPAPPSALPSPRVPG